jgi:hypothetical protein
MADDGKGGLLIYPPFVNQQGLAALARQFTVRDDDVFIVSYAKSGTNWLRQIVHLLANQGVQGEQTLRETVPLLEKEAGAGNWAALEYKGRRRYFMTHLPIALMPGIKQTQARYLYLARNPKDCAVSYYHFMVSRADLRFQGNWNEFFDLFIRGLVPYGLWFERVLEWWRASREADNILFMKYEEMQKDVAASVAAIAQFINIPLTAELLDAVVTQSSFAAMSANPKANWNLDPTRPGFPDKHLRKGTVGDWRNHFSAEQNAQFDALYAEKMAGSGLQFEFMLEPVLSV